MAPIGAHGQPGERMRTVTVTERSDGTVSDSPESLPAWRVGGRMPARPVIAEVLSDEQCAPDQRGISRCLNRMRLADGGRLVVRHPHSMARVPCLSPGERVRVVPG